MFPSVRKMERLTTICPVVMPEDTRVLSKGMEGTAPVGVVAAAEVAKTTCICPRAGNMMIAQVQAERRTRPPLTERSRNAGDVGRNDWSDPSVQRSSAKDGEEPGTGLTFAHPLSRCRSRRLPAFENADLEQDEAVTTSTFMADQTAGKSEV